MRRLYCTSPSAAGTGHGENRATPLTLVAPLATTPRSSPATMRMRLRRHSCDAYALSDLRRQPADAESTFSGARTRREDWHGSRDLGATSQECAERDSRNTQTAQPHAQRTARANRHCRRRYAKKQSCDNAGGSRSERGRRRRWRLDGRRPGRRCRRTTTQHRQRGRINALRADAARQEQEVRNSLKKPKKEPQT